MTDKKERELKEAHDHLRALLKVEWSKNRVEYGDSLFCPFCHTDKTPGHLPNCPRQAAQEYLDGLT